MTKTKKDFFDIINLSYKQNRKRVVEKCLEKK